MQKKHQLPFLIVLAGFAYGGYWFYDFTSEGIPKLEQRLNAREAELSTKSAELRRLRNFSENIEGVKLALRELNLQLEAALESMPRNYDLSGFLRKLSVVGFNSGIVLSAFRPAGAGTKEGDFYETLPVSFNLSGSFTQMMSFFDQILRLKRIVRIDRIAMRAAPAGSAMSRAGTGAQADVSAKLYRFVE